MYAISVMSALIFLAEITFPDDWAKKKDVRTPKIIIVAI